MPQVHQITNNRFIQFIDYKFKGAPLVERGWTQEIEEPYRVGTSIVVRVTPERAVVFGRWTGTTKTEDEALTQVTGLRHLSEEEFEGLDVQ